MLRLFARSLRMTLKIGGYKGTTKAQASLVNSAARTILASLPLVGLQVKFAFIQKKRYS